MKISKYNIFIQYENEEYILYNTLARSVLKINKKLKDILENNKVLQSIPQDLINAFCNNGVIINDDTDEIQLIKDKYFKEKFLNSNLQFIILPTYNCNLRCRYCYQAFQPNLKNKKPMSEEVVKFVIKFILNEINTRRPKRVGIGFFGGEPLFYPHIVFDIVNNVINELPYFVKNKEVGIVTNATLLSDDLINKLKSIHAPVSIFTTLAGDRELHNSRRMNFKNEGTYDKVINSIKKLCNSSFFVSVRIDADNSTVSTIDNLMEDLIDVKDNIMIRLGSINTDPDISKQSNNLISPFKSLIPISQIADKFAEKGFAVMEVEPFKPAFNWCSQQTNHTYTIDPTGDLYTCYDALVYPEQKIGSIDENGIATFNLEYYKWNSRNPFNIAKCRNCKLLPVCLGGCAFSAWLKNKIYDVPDKCEDFKVLFEKSVLRQVKYGMADYKLPLQIRVNGR